MILHKFKLDFQWQVQEPFLFCVHHLDRYPAGNSQFGIDSKNLKGRDIGQDFIEKDGFRMYHGFEVPGFPVHPHRGFETITIVRQGFVDHADSMGAAGRYGNGDVQWMTAGAGVQHSEMFPLLNQDKENTAELFQIWLNLPKKNKMSKPHFKMFWSEKIPKAEISSNLAEVSVIAGEFNGQKALSPPPDSWAADPQNEVLILLIKLKKDAELVLPKSKTTTNRTLYFFEGQGLTVNGNPLVPNHGFKLDSQQELSLKSSENTVEVLILQAKPIGEPVVQHGPFVMNTREEIYQTIQDYQRTQFGEWDWDRDDVVHGSKKERFAKYPNGQTESP